VKTEELFYDPERAYPGDAVEILVIVEQVGVILQGQLGYDAICSASNGHALAAAFEENASGANVGMKRIFRLQNSLCGYVTVEELPIVFVPGALEDLLATDCGKMEWGVLALNLDEPFRCGGGSSSQQVDYH
jgi:hypothetical protein